VIAITDATLTFLKIWHLFVWSFYWIATIFVCES